MSCEINIAPADRRYREEPRVMPAQISYERSGDLDSNNSRVDGSGVRINHRTRPAALGTFGDAQLKLLAYVRDRIHNGELTERGFARQIGISQPHAHNALKGVRTLSPEILDAILRYFHLSLLDLLSRPTPPGVIT
jgi:hypothetical protein